jgi:hypothetical protein
MNSGHMVFFYCFCELRQLCNKSYLMLKVLNLLAILPVYAYIQ